LDNGGSPQEPVLYNALRAALERREQSSGSTPQPAWRDFQDAVRALAVDPQGSVFFSGSEDGRLRRFDLRWLSSRGTVLTTFPKGVRAVAVNEIGSLLAAGSADGTLRVLDLRKPGFVREITGSGAPIVALAFQPKGALLATGRSDGDLSLWDPGNPTL